MNPTRDYTNQHVSVETSQNETLEGFVYAHDSVLNSLAIYSGMCVLFGSNDGNAPNL